MSYIILARNNDDRTAERIASFVDRHYLNSVKADCRAEHLDNVGLTARWMTWSAESKDEAEKLAEECRSAPNNFTVVHIIPDTTGESITTSRLSELISTPLITCRDYHGDICTFCHGMEIMHITDDGQSFAGTITSIASELLEISFIDGDTGWEKPTTCYLI